MTKNMITETLKKINALSGLSVDNIIEKIISEIKTLCEADNTWSDIDKNWSYAARFNVNYKWFNDKTLLHYAAEGGCERVIDALIQNGANIEVEDKEKNTPLHRAAKNGYIDIVNTLIGNGADVNKVTIYGRTPLFLAVAEGHMDIVNTLIDKGADVNKAGEDGKTPLCLAAVYGYINIVNTLINKGADVNLANLDIWAILLLALKKNYPNVVKALICKVPDVDRAVPDFRKTTGGRWTLLLWAAENGHKDVVDALIDKGADVDKVSELGWWSPLHLAADRGHVDIVEALINKGADVNKISQGRYTPLSLAAQYGHINVARILINNGANVNGGYSTHLPIYSAIHRGRKEVIELLLEKGADINATKGGDGATPLLSATYAGRKEVVELLLKKGADVNKAVGIGISIFLYNHEPLLINVLPLHYLWKTLDEIKAFLEENREKLKVKLGVHEKPLIDFVDFKDVAVRHTPRLELCAAVSAVIRNNAPSRNLGNPSSKQLQAVGQACPSSVDEQVPQPVSETTGTIEHISASDSEHGEVSEGDSTKILVSDQENDIQNNNQQPSNPSDAAPRSEKRNKVLVVAASALAIAGVISGIAIAVHLEMLAVGIAVGAICCLVAAAIIYCCNQPSKSFENSNFQGFSEKVPQTTL
ncbi:ankyrin repeat family protein [Trichonephila clavata]|uniref:Ankyrin repeat family protein n=1 Tax=Trichonephila clavata TaxID=2740835 RepID=A0A8X6HHY7_TRICU|nr:ankyrin repeat family protein [Trichonephila clavata]